MNTDDTNDNSISAGDNSDSTDISTNPLNQDISITSDLKTRLEALTERSEGGLGVIETWEPEPGDTLVGVLIGSQRAAGPYGENDQILLKDGDGKTTAAWLTAWLKSNMVAKGASRGDLVAITYLGKKVSSSRNTYNGYSLVVEKA